jgi:hypothetical protein
MFAALKDTTTNMITTLSFTQFLAAINNLTPLELQALKSAYESSDGNGHDFGYTDDIRVPGLKKGANGALVTSLIKKGVIVRDDEFGQFAFAAMGFYGKDTPLEKHDAAKMVADRLHITQTPPQEAVAPTTETETTTIMKTSEFTAPAIALFRRIIAEAGAGNEEVPTFDVFEKVKVDKPALEELVKAKVCSIREEKTPGKSKDIQHITITKKGLELRDLIEGEDMLADAPVVVDGTKPNLDHNLLADIFPAGKAKASSVAPTLGEAVFSKARAKVAGNLITGLTKDLKAAAKPAPFNRAALRYAAIQQVMAMTKAADWKKAQYKPALKMLQVDYAPLFSKLKTPEKVQAYAVGILDFCLAACRKLDTGKPEGI